MHDFIYSMVFCQVYYYIFYLFSWGPMPFTGYIGLSLSVSSLAFCVVSARFKFLLTHILVRSNYGIFKTYFYFKILYTIVAFLGSFYFIAALYYRSAIHELKAQSFYFVEGRREISDRAGVQRNLYFMGILFLVNCLHLLQNFFWIRLLNESFVDVMCRVKMQSLEDDDEQD